MEKEKMKLLMAATDTASIRNYASQRRRLNSDSKLVNKCI